VSVIDLGAGALSTGVSCGDGPSSLAVSPDGALVYVSDTAAGFMTVIDTRSRSITVTAPVGTEPERTALSPDGRRGYISNYVTNTVPVVDNASYRLLATIPVGIHVTSWHPMARNRRADSTPRHQTTEPGAVPSTFGTKRASGG
jgi:YVTN family beta-propeller protein